MDAPSARILLCFQSFEMRDEMMRLYQFSGTRECDIINDNHIYRWIPHVTAIQDEFFGTVIRVPDGKAGFLGQVQLLHRRFSSVLVYHRDVQHLDVNAISPFIMDNPRANVLEALCRLQLGREESRAFERMFYPEQRRPSVFGAWRLAAPVNLEAIFNHMEDDEDNDVELNRAIRASRQLEVDRQAALSQIKLSLAEGWESVLKDKSEPKQVGQPLCIVCLESRASICLVECGHQVMCDECVRIIWSRADVAHSCPVCQAPCSIITRPITSEVEQPPEKRKRRKS
jgi:hypothetical protein